MLFRPFGFQEAALTTVATWPTCRTSSAMKRIQTGFASAFNVETGRRLMHCLGVPYHGRLNGWYILRFGFQLAIGAAAEYIPFVPNPPTANNLIHSNPRQHEAPPVSVKPLHDKGAEAFIDTRDDVPN